MALNMEATAPKEREMALNMAAAASNEREMAVRILPKQMKKARVGELVDGD